MSTYNRARGARSGALVGGISAFLVMGVLTTLVTLAAEANLKADGGDVPSNPVLFVLGLSSAAALAGGLVGAGFGALVGQEDRYVVAR